MNTKHRIVAGIAAVGLVAGVGTVAGVVNIVSPANADQPTASAPSSAFVAVPASAPVKKGSTLVTFSEDAVTALSPLSPKGAAPGAFGVSPNGLSVQGVFPIVGTQAKGVIQHTGGLSLTDGTNRITLRNFQIDTARGVLTANGSANGGTFGRIAFLDVELLAPVPGCDASADLTLAQPAADALTALFDAPSLTGADIGTACVDLP